MIRSRTVLVLVAFLARTAFSEEASSKAGANAPPAKETSAKPAVPPAANVVITRDEGTGEARPATQPEIDRLVGPRPLARPDFVVTILPDGTRRLTLDDRIAHRAVASKNPDGSVSETCVPAAARSASPAPAK